ncbi:MAG: hypothetical protein QOF83_309 [Solirubrobacteraceae bacterium]|nr:hypothetical protein [Solirubrobacteraceae bacterium]
MRRRPPVAAVVQSRRAGEAAGNEAAAGQQGGQGGQRLTGRAASAVRGEKMPGRHALLGPEVGQEDVGLRRLERHGAQPASTVGAENHG